MVPSWHVVVYFILFFGFDYEVPIQGFDDEIDRPQVILDTWEDIPILHKLQHGTFSLSISAMENVRIGHQITRFRWENDLLF